MKYIILALTLLISACGSSRQVSSSVQEETPIFVPQQSSEDKEDVDDGAAVEQKTEDEKEKATEVLAEEKDTVQTDTLVHLPKDYYNIAVILPFYTQKVPLDYTPYQVDTNIYIAPETKKAMDFYMGIKLAVDDFKNKSKKYNVFVLDDGNNDYQTRKVLQERPFPDIDVIIGGSNYSTSKELLKFADERNIPTFSPFYDENIKITSENLMFTSPCLHDQLNTLFNYMLTQYPEATVYLIDEPYNSTSQQTNQMAEQILKSVFNIFPVRIKNTQNTINEEGTETSFFQPSSSSIVFVASQNESFVKSTLPKLYSAPFPTYILGLPDWKKLKDLENSTQPNPYIIIPQFKNATIPLSTKEQFTSRFNKEFQLIDNTDVYLGYDLMTYILKSLDENNIYQHPSSQSLQLNPLYYNFNFKPNYDGGKIDFYSNDMISLSKYTRGTFIDFTP